LNKYKTSIQLQIPNKTRHPTLIVVLATKPTLKLQKTLIDQEPSPSPEASQSKKMLLIIQTVQSEKQLLENHTRAHPPLLTMLTTKPQYQNVFPTLAHAHKPVVKESVLDSAND
jgi:hypothetical protein